MFKNWLIVPPVAPVILPKPTKFPDVVLTSATCKSPPAVLHESIVSSYTKETFASDPLSTSIPDVPAVTPAPTSPLLSVITLSVIVVLVLSTLVVVPVTVKSPCIVTPFSNVANPVINGVLILFVAPSIINVLSSPLTVPFKVPVKVPTCSSIQSPFS